MGAAGSPAERDFKDKLAEGANFTPTPQEQVSLNPKPKPKRSF